MDARLRPRAGFKCVKRRRASTRFHSRSRVVARGRQRHDDDDAVASGAAVSARGGIPATTSRALGSRGRRNYASIKTDGAIAFEWKWRVRNLPVTLRGGGGGELCVRGWPFSPVFQPLLRRGYARRALVTLPRSLARTQHSPQLCSNDLYHFTRRPPVTAQSSRRTLRRASCIRERESPHAKK